MNEIERSRAYYRTVSLLDSILGKCDPRTLNAAGQAHMRYIRLAAFDAVGYYYRETKTESKIDAETLESYP